MKKLDLGKENINKLLLTFSIPCVISMLINSVYNIVDQIFIGKGVGSLGNAATNVIFPLVIIFNATAGLIGNGASANLSLKLGEGDIKTAKKSIGMSITLSLIVSIILGLLSYILLPKLVYLFGCTDNVYSYALDYGRIIIMGAPFMIIYSSFSAIIRADGAPKYSMIMLVVGAIINIILDPIFIIYFHMGVKGGAIATIIGQFVSCVMALVYIPRIKSVKLEKNDYKIDKSVFRILFLGLSSFITQGTILVLFVFMNNMMKHFGSLTKFGADIPLSVYGVISKVNSLFISTVLGISIGSQPIIGFNYGAGNKERVKETLKKVLTINILIGIFFNLLIVLFPRQITNIFISKSDANYELFIEFAVVMCHSFLLLCSLNALEITTSIVIQALGNFKKATAVSFIRQIILFIPISCFLAFILDKGIYGILYGGLIADILCFIITIFIFRSEYIRLSVKENVYLNEEIKKNNTYKDKQIIITIGREYGSGGRYVGKMLADNLGINFYDKEIIRLSSIESGLSKEYISKIDETITSNYYDNNDNRLFLAESKIIKNIAKSESCVIVGRCADYILRNKKNVFRVFLYSDMDSKIARVTKYYGIDKNDALKQIKKINNLRSKHYKFYTGNNWNNPNNYDILLNVDKLDVEKTAKVLENIILNR